MHLLLNCIIVLASIILIRVISLICLKRKSFERRFGPAKTIIVLGSGGHTTEMMTILQEINKDNYKPRIYVTADSDKNSRNKVCAFEAASADYQIIQIFRSRSVGQSYFSSIFTTLRSILSCIPLMYKEKPDLVLCNGPGTCVPICLIAFLYRVLLINTNCRIVFVESFCRVQSLSLTGKLLIWFVDLFVVHWDEQKKLSEKIQYFGRLI